MPTSSGGSYPRVHSNDKLLSRRGTYTDKYYKYSSTTAPTSYHYQPDSSLNRSNYTLPSPTRSDLGLATDFSTKVDINNNDYRTKLPKRGVRDDYSTASSSSSTTYGSHYGRKVYPTANHSSSCSVLGSSGRSSPVDLYTTGSRTHKSNPALHNYNDSCSTHDSETAMKSTSASNFDGGNVGLTNLGNTCFMNSVLQCLLNTKALKDYVLSRERSADTAKTTSTMGGALMEEYALLVHKVWQNNAPTSTAPRDLKSKITRFAPRFSGYNQQDAQEFLRYFLQGLHDDVNRVTTKPKYIGDEEAESRMSDREKAEEYWRRYLNYDNSAIVDLFVGQLKSELECKTCGYKSVTFDPFWDLSLPIPKNRYEVDIHGCLESFMKEEILDGDERPTCAKCKVHRRCTKTFKIQKFPKILVLHLKRFSGERYRHKLSTKVNFKLDNLNLKQFGVNSSSAAATYNLYGTSNHVGSVYSGHYTAYCKHPYSGRWYSFNDSRVSSLSSGSVVSEEAYVLFYERAE